MKYLDKFKIFENKLEINPKDYIDEYFSVYDHHTEGQAIITISKIIKKIENIEYPFDVYLLDENDNVWTSDISNIINYHPSNSYVEKVTINNREDLDIEQTIIGRILELDYSRTITDSHYFSFKDTVKKEEVYLNIQSEIDSMATYLKDENVNIANKLYFANGEKKDMNIYSIELKTKHFLPIIETLDFLFRLDYFIKNEWNFTEKRPSHLHGKIDANIYLESESFSEYISIEDLEKKSKSFSVNLPFKKLTITYYKYLQ